MGWGGCGACTHVSSSLTPLYAYPCRSIFTCHVTVLWMILIFFQILYYDVLTSNFNNVSRNDVSCSDPLHALLVLTVHLSHLWFILFQSLNGVLCITLLEDAETEPVTPFSTSSFHCGSALAEMILPKTKVETRANKNTSSTTQHKVCNDNKSSLFLICSSPSRTGVPVYSGPSRQTRTHDSLVAEVGLSGECIQFELLSCAVEKNMLSPIFFNTSYGNKQRGASL